MSAGAAAAAPGLGSLTPPGEDPADPDRLEALYQAGTALFKAGDAAAALAHFTAVLAQDPGHVRAAFSRAVCNSLAGRWELAIDDYGHALAQDSRQEEERERRRASVSPTKAPRPALASANAAAPPPRAASPAKARRLPQVPAAVATSRFNVAAVLASRPPPVSDTPSPAARDVEPCWPAAGASVEERPAAAAAAVQAASAAQQPAARSSDGTAAAQPALPSSGGASPCAAPLGGEGDEEGGGCLPLEAPSPTKRPLGGIGAGSSASDMADAHHAFGHALRKAGDLAGAVAQYSSALRLLPTHFRARFNRAFCLDKVRAGGGRGAGRRAAGDGRAGCAQQGGKESLRARGRLPGSWASDAAGLLSLWRCSWATPRRLPPTTRRRWSSAPAARWPGTTSASCGTGVGGTGRRYARLTPPPPWTPPPPTASTTADSPTGSWWVGGRV